MVSFEKRSPCFPIVKADVAGSPVLRIQIIAPNDSILINQNVNDGALNAIEDYELPATGQYIIRVMERDGDQTFTFTISLY